MTAECNTYPTRKLRQALNDVGYNRVIDVFNENNKRGLLAKQIQARKNCGQDRMPIMVIKPFATDPTRENIDIKYASEATDYQNVNISPLSVTGDLPLVRELAQRMFGNRFTHVPDRDGNMYEFDLGGATPHNTEITASCTIRRPNGALTIQRIIINRKKRKENRFLWAED